MLSAVIQGFSGKIKESLGSDQRWAFSVTERRNSGKCRAGTESWEKFPGGKSVLREGDQGQQLILN